MKLIKKETNEKIKKSKEIIKKEKQKNKAEKKKQRQEKIRKNKLLPKIFKSKKEEPEALSIGEQIFTMIYFELIGVILCLLVLFALSGGKNYFKLYNDLKKLINVYDTIDSKYYGELNKEELINNAINSMITSLGDDYTIYTDDTTANDFLEELEGTYEGIGCTVSMNMNGEIIVVSLFEGGPAKKAGLQENDIILKVDDEDFTDKTSEEMANYVKKTSNSKLKFILKRNDEEKEITIKREKIEVPTVTGKILEQEDNKIGYIDISIFSAVTYEQFKNELEKLEKDNIQGLIIDVRSDTGGYLSAVTDITNLFLKKGKIIYQLEDNNGIEKIKDNTKEHREYPVAVLINSSSASASEILASAIKESYDGIIIGTNSYGKGTVQKTQILKDGSMLKYTTQNWLTPKGNWINEIGVEPTVEVLYDITSETDNQLETAVTEITNILNK